MIKRFILSVSSGSLDFMQYKEGSVLKVGAAFNYEYNASDHLGNMSVSVNNLGTVMQSNYYYPFGLTRLSKVYASTQAISAVTPSVSALQAEYEYYLHGPLKKVILADGLEETEYTYTLQGWLKGINNPADADRTFAQAIYYFNGDYSRTGNVFPTVSLTSPQYNGNISAVKHRTDDDGTVEESTMKYTYDVKYQLASAYNGTNNAFKVDNLAYDANGNIKSIRRKDASGANNRNDLAYTYISNKNQLDAIADAGTQSNRLPIE